MYTAAIIGISGYGEAILGDLTSRYPKGGIKVIGATVINQDQEAEKCNFLRSQGCEIFSDYREMLAKLHGKIDLCCIPTGIGMHKDMTLAALEAEANVYVEKPLCATVQDAAVMKAAETRSGKFVIVGYQHIMQPSVRELKSILLSGQLGKTISLKCTRFGAVAKSYYLRNNWAGKIRMPDGEWVLDSPYNNSAAHNLNLILFLAGNSFESSAQIKNIQAELYRSRQYIENAENGFMRMETVDGKKLFFAAGLSYDMSNTSYMHIECEHGSITTEDNHYVVTFANGETKRMPVATDRHAVTRAVYNKLRDPQSFACPIEVAANQTLAVNGAHESSEIIDVPGKFTETTDPGTKDEKIIIKGLHEVVKDCYERNLLPNELGTVPWAKAGKLFDLRDYHTYLAD